MTEQADKDRVVPGDFLAGVEEAVPGPNAFEEQDSIYSAVLGERRENRAAREAGVQAYKNVRLAGPGDLAYGRVRDIFEAMASIEIQAAPSPTYRPAINDSVAYLRISEVMRGYVERFRDVLRIGDLVRARVVQTSPLAVYVTIKDDDLGVVRANCSYCRTEMEFRHACFECPNCGSREERKTPGGSGGPQGRSERDGRRGGRGAERGGHRADRREGGGRGGERSRGFERDRR